MLTSRFAKAGFASLLLLAPAACSAPADAPAQAGMCWIAARASGPAAARAKPHFVLLSRGDPNLETCAMHLELTRISKRRPTVFGAFQGQYVFVDRETIASSESLSGQRFSLFTPGQRSDLDGQIVDLLKAPTPGKTAKPAPAS
jgi:hypothetical protein